MWWLAEGVDERKRCRKAEEDRRRRFLTYYYSAYLLIMAGLQGAESDIIMNSLIIVSITGLQAVNQTTRHLDLPPQLAVNVNDPKSHASRAT